MTACNEMFRAKRQLVASLMIVLFLQAGMMAQNEDRLEDQTFFTFEEADGAGEQPLRHNFNVTNADVRTVFKALSERIGVDIILSRSVQGELTMNLTSKTWHEIFLVVCRILKLTPIKEEGYVYVVTSDEFKRQQLDDASALQAAPLKREIIPLSNTTVSEMQQAVQSMLSSRGRMTTTTHNNALIILDTEENIKDIRKTIEKLDIETQQITIACKIIEVSSGTIQNIGIHWGYFNSEIGIGGSHLPQRDFVAGALEKLSYGILSPERFSVALEYLYQDNKGEVVAQPSITTLDNKEARIFMGQQVPLSRLDEAGNTVVTMIDAGTELVVTPHVTGEGRIMLELKPKKKSYSLAGAVGQYIINEQSAETNVVVSDGETVVIAGLTTNEIQNAEDGIPFLKNIPILGHLFKRSSKNKTNKDLIIFVTPHIIQKESIAVQSPEPANQ